MIVFITYLVNYFVNIYSEKLVTCNMQFECAVCNSPIAERDRDNVASLIKCGHVFHFTCIDKYLCLIKECPQCDSKAPKGSIIRIYPRPVDEDSSAGQEALPGGNKDNKPQENVSQLSEDNERLKQQIEDLKKSLTDCQMELKIWEILFEHLSKLEAEKQATMDEQLEVLKKTVHDLERDLSSTKANLVSTKAELDSTKINVYSIKTEPGISKKAIKQEETLNECVENLQLTIENSNLKSELENVKNQLDKYEQSVTDLVVQHSKEVNTSTEHNTNLNALNEMLTEINASLERENKLLAKEKVTLLEDMTIITAEKISIQDHNNALIEDNEALKKEHRSLVRKCTLLQKEINALKQDKDILNNFNKLLKNKIGEYEINITALRKQIEQMTREIDGFKKETLHRTSNFVQQENYTSNRNEDSNVNNEITENFNELINNTTPQKQIQTTNAVNNNLGDDHKTSQQEISTSERDKDTNLNECKINNSTPQKQTAQIYLDNDNLADEHTNLQQGLETSKFCLAKENAESTQKANISSQNECENKQQNKSFENVTKEHDQANHSNVSSNESKKLELMKNRFERCFRPDKRKTLDISLTQVTPEKRPRTSGASDDGCISEPCSKTPEKRMQFDMEDSTSDSKIEHAASQSTEVQATHDLCDRESQDSVVVVEDSQMSSQEESDAPLPEGWEMRTSRSTDMTYFLNSYTKKSQWERPDAPANAGKVRCSHLLVKHAGSRRPRSWREENITRSLDEATELVKNYRKQIVANEATFTDLASKYSDCSSAKQGGDMGHFGRGQWHESFEEETFKLKVGQLSQPVETNSGVHIILRTA